MSNQQTEGESTLSISTSRNFTGWLKIERASLLFTTYRVGKVFMVGLSTNDQLHITERTFNRCMGLGTSADSDTFWMSSLFQLWRFDNSLREGHYQDYDKVYLPQAGYTTGDLDIHISLSQKKTAPFLSILFLVV